MTLSGKLRRTPGFGLRTYTLLICAGCHVCTAQSYGAHRADAVRLVATSHGQTAVTDGATSSSQDRVEPARLQTWRAGGSAGVWFGTGATADARVPLGQSTSPSVRLAIVAVVAGGFITLFVVERRKRLRLERLRRGVDRNSGQDGSNGANAQESRAVYRTLIDTTNDAILIADAESGIILEANCRAADFFGIAWEELIGMHQTQLHPSEEAERYAEVFRAHVLEGAGLWRDFEICRPDGRRIPVNISACVAEFQGRKVIYGAFRDVSEQKRVERELRKSEEKYRGIFDESIAAVYVFDLHKRFIDSNRAGLELLGYTREELLGMSIPDVDADPHLDRPAHERLLAGEPVVNFEHRLRRKNGDIITVLNNARPLTDPGGRVVGTQSTLIDITERVRMEAALRNSEAVLKKAQEIAHLGSWELDLEQNVLSWSDEVYRIFGLAPQAFGVTLQAFLDAVHPDDRELVNCAYAASVEGQVPYDVTHRILRPDGDIRYVHEKCDHVRDDASNVIRSVGTVLDITERYQAENALIRAKEAWERTFDTIPDMVAIIDTEHHIVRANRAMADRMGLDPDRCIGKVCHEAVHGTTEPPPHCPHVELLEDGREHVAEVCEKNLHGDFLVSVSPLLDGARHLIGSVHVARDISDGKRAEEKLRLSEAKYRTLFECANDAIFVFDPDSETIIEANRQACMTYGYSHDELIGQSLDLFQPEERRGRAKTMEIVEQTTSHGFETTHRRKDGMPVPVEIRARMVEFGGQEAVLSVNRDISDRKRAEEEQSQLEEQLRHAQAMKAVGQLAAGIAHEFNNLLVGIIGNTELLLTSLTDETESFFRQPLEDIDSCGQRAAALTQQLLGFAKKRKSDVRRLDLNAIVLEVTRLLHRLIGEGISLQTDLAEKLFSIKADQSEMQRAIMNLAINARDAMPHGGTLTIRTRNRTLDDVYVQKHAGARTGRHVELVVSDTGCGMSEETAGRIFEPFFTTKPEGKGTGLGLATVMDDITSRGGHIAVDTRVGTGTTIRICVPEAAPTAVDSDDEPAHPKNVRLTGSETILVCDDEELVLESVASRLEAAGYRVIRARSGREALELASLHDAPVSLLVTDVVMPAMNGPQLARELTRQHKGLGVMYMSGYPSDVLQSGAEKGCNVAFLQKPPTGEALLTRVRHMLDRCCQT